MDISTIVSGEICTGCGTCYSVCPTNAIELVLSTEKGLYSPVINRSLCTDCGTCYEICPGHGKNLKQLNLAIFGRGITDLKIGDYSNCYVGYSSNHELRVRGSSGALVTELLLFALDNGLIDGALVSRMSPDKPTQSESMIARNRDEILSAMGSIYCPVATNQSLKEIIRTSGKYAVVGLPCHIIGIRKSELLNDELRRRIVLHIGLFCGSSTNYNGTRFLMRKREIDEGEVTRIQYRGNGWPGTGYIQSRNGHEVELRYPKYYDGRFSSFTPRRCRLCNDHASEFADISFGDAWLPDFAQDECGTSVVITRSKKADDILERLVLAGRIELRSLESERVIESQHGMRNKKRDLDARMRLSALLGHAIPSYDHDLIVHSPFISYVNDCIHSFPRHMARDQRMWELIDLYWSAIEWFGRLRSRF